MRACSAPVQKLGAMKSVYNPSAGGQSRHGRKPQLPKQSSSTHELQAPKYLCVMVHACNSSTCVGMERSELKVIFTYLYGELKVNLCYETVSNKHKKISHKLSWTFRGVRKNKKMSQPN